MLELIKAAFRGFMDDEAPRLAAALSFYTVFSLPPLLILVIMIAGLVWDAEDVQGRIVQEMGGVVGPRGAEQIRNMIRHADRPGSGGSLTTALSVGALVFGATGAFGQLQNALNRAWGVRKDPEKGSVLALVTSRVLSFAMILVIAFLLMVSLVLSAVLTSAGESVAALLPAPIGQGTLWTLDAALSLLVFTLLFMAMYRVLPDARVEWGDVWRGALATAVLFVAGKFLLGLYIARTDPGSAYGAAGSLAVILVWIYYSAMIFLLGAEFTQAHAELRGGGIRPDADAVRIVREGRRKAGTRAERTRPGRRPQG